MHIPYVNITNISVLSLVPNNKDQFTWCNSIHYVNWD